MQVNMSQTRSASVCCDEEGPFVDVREYTWSSTTDKTCGQTREATDTGIQLGKSSLRVRFCPFNSLPIVVNSVSTCFEQLQLETVRATIERL